MLENSANTGNKVETAAPKPDIAIWLFGLFFLLAGIVMSSCAASMAYIDAQWNGSVRTQGIVILTEWRNENDESRMHITYGYRDPSGAIFHNQAVIARRYGKLNLEPGSPIIVLYKPEDHSRSHLEMETTTRDWMPLVFLGVVETIVGGAFIAHCIKRYPPGADFVGQFFSHYSALFEVCILATHSYL
jgi:hypothetical protein